MVKKAEVEPKLTEVSWEAQEVLQCSKNAGWYAGLAFVVAVFSGLAILLQWWTFLVLIVVSAIALVVYSARPPRMIKYSVGEKGITDNNKLHAYEEFKGFGVLEEAQNYSIILIPRKRFAPRRVIYFPKDKGEQIVDILGVKLPMQKVELDFLDKLVRFLRI